ncbi:MAG: peroxiredoxin [Gloeomargaritaceae cyanobacterium C42_A2020_066]|nr:peroxiredoxin [Gloeomargaritaceae cyanobacterium C42_A2020_066]
MFNFLNDNNRVTVGEQAPDFSLPDQTGQLVSLQDWRGKAWVVLYFYPKDDTPGCTAEACGFRDSHTQFEEAGAVVLGISSDDTQSHTRFANRYQLPFRLLSDGGNQVRQRYGVPATFGLIPGRVTYVIDPQGIVRHIFDSQFNFQAHITEALRTVRGTTG